MTILKFLFGKLIGEAAYVTWKTDGWKGKFDAAFLCILFANMFIDFLTTIAK